MLDHHLQRSIVYSLAFSPKLKFSELKPDDLDSKLFTYHLKKVVSAGFVTKGEDGLYMLTPEGRRLGAHVLEKQLAIANSAVSVLFLVVRRKTDNAWLLYKRKTHPLLGKIGFMHCSPTHTEESRHTAASELKNKTGVTGDFFALGGGFFRVFEGENLESFTLFTLMICDEAEGELTQNDEYAEYFWTLTPEFDHPDMLPNMSTLAKLYESGKTFFIERRFDI